MELNLELFLDEIHLSKCLGYIQGEVKSNHSARRESSNKDLVGTKDTGKSLKKPGTVNVLLCVFIWHYMLVKGDQVGLTMFLNHLICRQGKDCKGRGTRFAAQGGGICT